MSEIGKIFVNSMVEIVKDSITCKTCKWWGVYYQHVCDYSDDLNATGDKKRFEIDYNALDDQGLEVFLKTGPDFGCIHHKTKDY